MRKHLASVLHYFAQFTYSPTFDEIYLFYPKKITKKMLKNLIQAERKADQLVRLPNKQEFSLSIGSPTPYTLPPTPYSYTLPQYSMRRQSTVDSQQSKSIDVKLRFYLKILKIFPFVRFVGVTGKSAMEGYRKNDDIDLFIITKSGFLWTTRFLAIFFAKVLGIHGGNGVCLNLFFDEQDLVIPKVKQNMYIAHELLQMKPIVDKGDIYWALLGMNRWIFDIFPNSTHVIPMKIGIQSNVDSSGSRFKHGMTHIIDKLFKSIQLPIITKNKTAFRITLTQLWLFKKDFEIKLKRKASG